MANDEEKTTTDFNSIEDFSIITNIQERRKAVIPYLVDNVCIPYNQYNTARNINILRAFVYPMFDATLIGYEYQDDWENQTGKEKEDAIYRVFRIKRTFQGITMTDEQLDMVANFAEAIRMINVGDISEVAEAIEKNITNEFAIFSSAREVLYILYTDDVVVKALIYYKLIPTSVASNTKILAIPKEFKGMKLWLWGIVPQGTSDYWLPSIGAPFLYEKEEGSDEWFNPLLILPEWYYIIND